MTVSLSVVTDATRIHAMLNHPEVRPWVASADEGLLDVSDKVGNPNITFLMGSFGGVMLLRIMPGIWEVHTFVLPEGRGGWSLDMIRAAQNWLFSKTDAFEVLTRIPKTHKAALGLALKAGMSLEYHRPDGVKFNGQVVSVDVYKLTVQDWLLKAPFLEERGQQFHRWLNREAAANGFTHPHEDDPEHNRVVGASLEMFLGGQAVKGVQLYNRWAWMARHATITLESLDPIVVAFDIGKLKLADGNLEFLPCAHRLN